MLRNIRIWQRQPGFAAIAIVALAIAIGANSVLFTIVNALLLRPLPFEHSEQLVELSTPERRTQVEDFAPVRSIEAARAMLAHGFPIAHTDGVRNHFGLQATADLIPLLHIH